MKVTLITGGTGYIGSHAVVELINQNIPVLIVDNFDNSKPEVLNRIEKITGVKPRFIEGDLLNTATLESIFTEFDIESVIHFAGLKAVNESVNKPLHYYNVNLVGAINLLNAMKKHDCKRFVFSSSATVYGNPNSTPIQEHFPLSTTNPYGRSKLMIEDILRDLAKSDRSWSIAILRYFNPISAHDSGLIGEDPQGIPNNLMPYISQVAVQKIECLSIFGNDYDTPDGTGVRDYIHVVDLAIAHCYALNSLKTKAAIGENCQVYNIGTGVGYSVLEMINAFENASETKIPFSIKPRREGDIASCYADPAFSLEKLHWQAKYGLDKMMQDQWKWQSNNPHGYS